VAATLGPRHREYHRLRETLASYRTIAGHGGWPQLLRQVVKCEATLTFANSLELPALTVPS
jgi:hypothetical protein